MLNVYPSAGESILYGSIQRCAISNLDNGLDCRSHVSAVVRKRGGARSNLNLPRCRLGIGSKMIIEAPRPYLLAKSQQFGCALGIGHCRKHALERGKVFSNDIPLAISTANTHRRSTTVYEHRCWPKGRRCPHTFSLYFRIQLKSGGLKGRRNFRRRQPEINAVANVFGHESQPQRHYLTPRTALNGYHAGLHASRDLLWPRPQS